MARDPDGTSAPDTTSSDRLSSDTPSLDTPSLDEVEQDFTMPDDADLRPAEADAAGDPVEGEDGA